MARRRGVAVTSPEHSAVGDSQCDGFMEFAVRTAEETVRTSKLDSEARISQKIEHRPQGNAMVDETRS